MLLMYCGIRVKPHDVAPARTACQVANDTCHVTVISFVFIIFLFFLVIVLCFSCYLKECPTTSSPQPPGELPQVMTRRLVLDPDLGRE